MHNYVILLKCFSIESLKVRTVHFCVRSKTELSFKQSIKKLQIKNDDDNGNYKRLS